MSNTKMGMLLTLIDIIALLIIPSLETRAENVFRDYETTEKYYLSVSCSDHTEKFYPAFV